MPYLTPHLILVLLGLILAVLSLPWPNHYLLAVAVVLLAVAQFVPK